MNFLFPKLRPGSNHVVASFRRVEGRVELQVELHLQLHLSYKAENRRPNSLQHCLKTDLFCISYAPRCHA